MVNANIYFLFITIDLLAMVANCGVMQYTADQTKRFQEAIVMDNKKKPLFFTIWEDLASNEGTELLRQVRQLQEYPVIVAIHIATKKYHGGKLMKFLFLHMDNASLLFINKICIHSFPFGNKIQLDLINPLYVQATELRNWANENKQMLIEYTMKSSTESASSLNLVVVDDEILSVSTIAMQTSTVVLNVIILFGAK
ncbi:uncharacterized protein [Nicotiana tomentosiformis]|uniref:uncharacterized protein isoform X2 n=1 Tax=Nicotiana tomentosiformis TaxID=4098 RepID=UPI00388C4C50